MGLLVLGLVLFFTPHLFTSFVRGPRDGLVTRLGLGPYKGIYSLISAAGLLLIILGWRAADPVPVYDPPAWGRHANFLLTPLALVLFVAAELPAGKIKAWVGHPMVTGVILFSGGHLLANGDQRSLAVFGAFLAYGILDRAAVKLRGERGPAAGSLKWDLMAVVVAAILSVVLILWLHRWVAGVPLVT